MVVATNIFRSYDIRGVADREIPNELAGALGRAFVLWLQKQGIVGAPLTVVVGRDMRESSERLLRPLVAGLIQGGVHVKNIGLVASEQFYYACATSGAPGIMVTASHNPPEYGGFKLVKEIPYFVGGDDIQELRTLIERDELASEAAGGNEESWDIHEGYIAKVLGGIDASQWGHAPSRVEGRRLRVVVDAANGMGGPMTQEVFARLPLDLECLFCDPDGRFPNHPADPLIADNRRWIEAAVPKMGADIGIAFDGDADRAFIIDETGKTIPGDFLTAILGEEFVRRNPGSKIIYDVRSSWAVRDFVTRAGGEAIMHRVGHTYIKRFMKETGAIFAGEVSGHYYYHDFFGCDSGMLTALLMLDILGRGSERLSTMVEPLRARYFISGELNFYVADRVAALDAFRARYKNAAKYYELDGISVEEADWHFNVRASNTEPLLRLTVEALSQNLLKEKVEELTNLIKGIANSS